MTKPLSLVVLHHPDFDSRAPTIIIAAKANRTLDVTQMSAVCGSSIWAAHQPECFNSRVENEYARVAGAEVPVKTIAENDGWFQIYSSVVPVKHNFIHTGDI
jgi:hypothetical protein